MQRWLSKNIAILSLAPAFLLVAFILFSMFGSLNELSNARLTQSAAKLSNLSSVAIQQIQTERGMSAGFIASNGETFASQLSAQREATDTAIQKVLAAESLDDIPTIESTFFAPLSEQYRQLSLLRGSIDSLSIDAKNSTIAFSRMTQLILDFNGALVAIAQNGLGKQKLVLLYRIATLQEKAGLERAALNVIFSAGTLNDTQVRQANTLAAEQNSVLYDLEVLATEEFRSDVQAFKQSAAQQNIETFRQQINNYPDSPFTASSEEWFAQSSARINEIASMYQRLFSQLDVHAGQESSRALFIVVLDVILLLITLVLTKAIYFVLNIRKRQSMELQNKLSAINNDLNLTLSVEKISNDDLGTVTSLLNKLIGNFRNDLISFQTGAEEIAAASQQSAISLEQTNENIHLQQQSISSSLLATETLAIGINADLESITQLTKYATTSSKMVGDGEGTVKAAVDGIRATAANVKSVGQTIEVVNARVDDILRMVDVIRSVADQTNLLALNAAIEAARAGEQGRGFAVVADEVRALAKRTQESTQQIADVVDELNASSKTAFDSIASGSQTADNAVGLADKINTVLSSIAGNMRELENLTLNVDQSAQQQSYSLQQITDEIRKVDAAASQNAASSEQIASASYQLSNVTEEMRRNIKRYKV